ncbi:hypothetical protein ORJ66_15590 [Pseudoalteromonas tunicata]|uniref:DUF6702 family protein n=1 Tax=Pseudoalteromonas tunicata TaxID=314281 RepID=UPI00273DC135|nr:DUF6702 family protein [Pseudoalteromonas tunicata]MDP5214479.1 hypothetical protein [Pseudoalteromonas tunicata]
MFKAVITVALLLLSQAAWAHQLKAAITTVLFNERTNNLEVMHRFYLHDSEHAIQHLYNKNADLMQDDVTQTQFARYVEGQFKLQTLSGEPLNLHSVGHQIEGKFFWVYQEIEIPKKVKGFRMSHGALRELWPSQVNMVNIEGKGEIKTLTFSGDDQWLSTELSK